MRRIKREITYSKVQALESKGGNVSDLGVLTLIGEPNIFKIKKELAKRYPDRNVFYGSIKTETKTFTMSVDEFMQHAHVKSEKVDDETNVQ